MAWKKKERNSKTNRTQIVAGFVTCAKQFSPQTHFLQANDEREENNLFPQNSENLHRVLRTSERKLLHILISCRCKNFFSMSLKDKICIVTGAAVGLGRAFCEQLLKQGAFVRKKSFGLIKSEKEFNNRLRFFFRFLSLILTQMPANFVAWSCSSNLERIVQYFATVMSQTIHSSKV